MKYDKKSGVKNSKNKNINRHLLKGGIFIVIFIIYILPFLYELFINYKTSTFYEEYDFSSLCCQHDETYLFNRRDLDYCPKCGKSIYDIGKIKNNSGKYCAKHGFQSDDWDYCSKCGLILEYREPEYWKISELVGECIFKGIYRNAKIFY